MTQPPHMWSYWRDKKGTVEAVEDYFPEVLAENTQLAVALATVKNNLVIIDELMTERIPEDDD